MYIDVGIEATACAQSAVTIRYGNIIRVNAKGRLRYL